MEYGFVHRLRHVGHTYLSVTFLQDAPVEQAAVLRQLLEELADVKGTICTFFAAKLINTISIGDVF